MTEKLSALVARGKTVSELEQKPQASEDLLRLPTISGLPSRLAAERLLAAGVEISPILRLAGLPSDLMKSPIPRVSTTGETAFLNLAAEHLDDSSLGFHIALAFDLRRLGFCYYLLSSSDNVGQASEKAEKLISSSNVGIRIAIRHNSSFSIEFSQTEVQRDISRQQIEFWATCTLRLCRSFTNIEIIPSYIGFTHTRATDIAEMEDYFACHINLRAKQNRVSFEPQVADLPFVTADPYLNCILTTYHSDTLAQRQRINASMRARVENSILTRLPEGTAVIGNVAADLGMSSRTLSRRLSGEDLTFSLILEEVRSDLAQRYVQDENLTISQIAWMLGYRELSSFIHAFQRWTGTAPTEVRRHSRQTNIPD